jgi:hypothetical protein
MMILILILILTALLTAFLLLRLRVRVDLSRNRRLMFVGLGRSGPEMDFAHGTGLIRLFGVRIGSFSLKSKKKAEAAVESVPLETGAKRSEKKPARQRSVRDFVSMSPKVVSAVWRFLAEVVKAAAVEQCEGELRAGFEQPHLTGQAFGYYHALVGAVPAIGRFQFVPDWTGASFSAELRFAVAVPMYAIAYRTIILMFQLPIRRLIRFARGKKKGAGYDK